jgi:hypothetical protein
MRLSGDPPLGIAAGQLLENLQHPVLIETAVTKIRFSVGPKLKLPAMLGGRRINPCPSQALQMVMLLRRIYDVNCLVAAFEAFLYERKQHAILFVIAVKKRTDMTYLAELRAGKGDWRQGDGTALYLICTLVAAAKAPPHDSLDQ